MAFAGSAIAQNAGRLDNFDSWRPGPEKTKWLLMAGRVAKSELSSTDYFPQKIEFEPAKVRPHDGKVEITVKIDQTKKFKGIGANKKMAKLAAAKCALRKTKKDFSAYFHFTN